jgi:hypothetical protein
MALRIIYALSWLLFLLAILFLGWENARSYHVVVGMLAFPGLVIGIVWSLRKNKWDYVALGMSIVTLLGYFAWWQIEIFDRYSVDSSSRLLDAVAMQLRIPRLLFQQRLVQDDSIGALVEGYWQLGMPILQIIFLVLILGRILHRRSLALTQTV